MLQAVPRTQTLQIDALPWLVANTIRIRGDRCLIVQRSTQLSQDDETYRPVLEFLAANPHSVQCGPEISFDEDIKGGFGEVTTYRLAVP